MTKETKFILVTSHKVFIKSRWNKNISLSQLVVYPANEHASAKKATHTYFHLSLNSRQTFYINFQLEADKSFQCLNFSWNPWQLRLWLFYFLQNHLSFTHCPLSNHLANFEFFRLSFLVHHAQRKSYQWYSYRKKSTWLWNHAFAPLLAQNDPVLQRFTKNSREIRLTKLSKNKKNSTWTSWGLALPRCWPEMTPNRAQNHRCWPPRPSQHHSQSNHVQHEASFAKYLTRFWLGWIPKLSTKV